MGEKEDIEDFHSRFLILVNGLAFLGEILPPWRQVTKVLQCLNSTWDPIANALQANGNTKEMDVEVLFGKLSSYMDNQKRNSLWELRTQQMKKKVMTSPSSPRLSRSYGRSKGETLMAQVPWRLPASIVVKTVTLPETVPKRRRPILLKLQRSPPDQATLH